MCGTTTFNINRIPIPTSSAPLIAKVPKNKYILSLRDGIFPEMKIQIETVDTKEKMEVDALLDSGATGLYVDREFVKKNRLNTRKLHTPIPVYNVDGTQNAQGSISEVIDFIMKIDDHNERATFAVTGLGKKNLIVGESWLKIHNPEIDWITGKIKFTHCPRRCDVKIKHDRMVWKKKKADEDRIFMVFQEHPLEESSIRNISQNLAIEAEKKKIKKSFEEIVPSAYHRFKAVFAKESFDEMPHSRLWDHAIELKPGSKRFAGKIYNLSPDEQKQLEVFLDENLKSRCIHPSKSLMASPFLFIKKKSGELRPIQDYRKLNDMTIKNSYPLPLILELIDKLKGAKIFTKLDICWGYNNVHIKTGDEWKAAFITNFGLFEPLVMFFGLTNSPDTFQTMMNHLFMDLIACGSVVIYMDDILIFTASLEEHCRIVAEVLQILQDNKLFLKPEKCDFEKAQIDYLGLIVSFNRIMMDPVKVQGIADWPQLTNLTEVRSFLGFCNFYRCFIRNFSQIAKPLNELMQKDKKWTWDLQ